jgi:hypothetical protein
MDQHGAGNSATTTQTVEQGLAASRMTQGGNDNTADVTQTVGFGSASSIITQNGLGNTAIVDQFSPAAVDNHSDITVSGNANHTTVLQGLASEENSNRSSIELSGNGNSAAVTQSGTWGANIATITGVGNDNSVVVDQKLDIATTFDNLARNLGQIGIDGHSNQLDLKQSVDGHGGNDPGSNTYSINVLGNNGVISVVQSSGP